MAKKRTVPELRNAYRSVFSGPDGAIVLEDILKFCGMGDSSVVLGDSHGTAENEGKRRIALRIVKFINMPDQEAMRIALTARTEDE